MRLMPSIGLHKRRRHLTMAFIVGEFSLLSDNRMLICGAEEVSIALDEL